MRARSALMCIMLMLASVGASRGSSLPAEGIGIFWDLNGGSCRARMPAFVLANAYLLLLSSTSADSVAAWECSVVTSPSPLPAGMVFLPAGDGANALTLPDVRVTLPIGLPRTPATLLATLRTFYLGGYVAFGLGPCHPTSVPGLSTPSIRTVGDGSAWRPVQNLGFWPFPGVPDALLCADIGGTNVEPDPCCPGCDGTPTSATSWGAIKILYE